MTRTSDLDARVLALLVAKPTTHRTKWIAHDLNEPDSRVLAALHRLVKRGEVRDDNPLGNHRAWRYITAEDRRKAQANADARAEIERILGDAGFTAAERRAAHRGGGVLLTLQQLRRLVGGAS